MTASQVYIQNWLIMASSVPRILHDHNLHVDLYTLFFILYKFIFTPGLSQPECAFLSLQVNGLKVYPQTRLITESKFAKSTSPVDR